MARARGGREALPAALRFLARRAASREEVRAALRRKGLPEDEIDRAVTRVEEMGLLRERQAAESHARSLLEGRAFGKGRIGLILRRRGFPEPDVREILAGIGPEEEEGALRRALGRLRGGRDLGDPRAVRRIAAALCRRGFATGAVRAALEEAGARWSGGPPDEEE